MIAEKIATWFMSEPVTKRCKQCDQHFIAPHKIVSLCSEECKQAITDEEYEKFALSRYYGCQIKFPKVHSGAEIHDFHRSRLRGRKPFFAIDTQGYQIEGNLLCSSYVQSDSWLLFMSSPETGIGKTRLGLIVLAELARKNVLVHPHLEGSGYFKSIDIAKVMESERFDNKKKITNAFENSAVLMIDELGFEDSKQSHEISALIQQREEKQLRTIITTNLTEDQLYAKYGQKFLSRIGTYLLNCTGSDWRI